MYYSIPVIKPNQPWSLDPIPGLDTPDWPSSEPRRENFLRGSVHAARSKMRSEGWEGLNSQEKQLALQPQIARTAALIKRRMTLIASGEDLLSAGMIGAAGVLARNSAASATLVMNCANGYIKTQISAELGIKTKSLGIMRTCARLWEKLEDGLSQQLKRKPDLSELEAEFVRDPDITKKRKNSPGFTSIDFDEWRLRASLYNNVLDSIFHQNNATYLRAVNRPDSLTCPAMPGPEEQVQKSWEQGSKFWSFLEQTLTQAEFYIVARHAGLEHSFQEIGDDLRGVTSTAIQQNFAKTMRRMRIDNILPLLKNFQNGGTTAGIEIDESVHRKRVCLMGRKPGKGRISPIVAQKKLERVRAALSQSEVHQTIAL
jgi:hypothetical protein